MSTSQQPVPFGFRVTLQTSVDLSTLRHLAGVKHDKAVAQGLTMLLGLWADLGDEGFLRLDPPQDTVATIAAAPEETATHTMDSETVVTLDFESQQDLDFLCGAFDADPGDVVRHALRVAAVLHEQIAADGRVVPVGGYNVFGHDLAADDVVVH